MGQHEYDYSLLVTTAATCAQPPTPTPQFERTTPVAKIGPFKQWWEHHKIASMDPFGHVTTEAFGAYLKKGFDIRPTIAVTKVRWGYGEGN